MKMKNLSMLLLVFMGYGLIMLGSSTEAAFLLETVVWEKSCVSFSFSVLVDEMSIIFMGVVLTISGSVSVYCSWYMNEEVYYERFFKLLWLFVISMMFMILIPNLIMVLLGWDGLGLTSFLLVAFYQNNKSLASAMLTALTNRVGDTLVLASISFMLNEMNWVIYNYSPMIISASIGFVLILAGMTKSAQVPFCAWLPAAMAAPTPVSSLVHSSTLVTAGVYLLLRSYKMISLSESAMKMLMVVSVLTLLVAGSSAVRVYDLKKVIALSTLSQLSVMMFCVSIGAPLVAFFHLVTHAVFEALLFMGAGGLIHSNKSVQDVRVTSQVWQTLPVSSAAVVVAIVSLSGGPFMSGFFSKDLIIELSMSDGNMQYGMYLLEVFGLSFTSWYSSRLVFVPLLSSNLNSLSSLRVKEGNKLTIPLLSLFVGAVLLGSTLKMKMENLEYVMLLEIHWDASYFMISVVGLGCWMFGSRVKALNSSKPEKSYFVTMWHVETLTCYPFCCIFFWSSGVMYKELDQGWLEVIGPQGLYSTLMKLSQMNESAQSHYFMAHMGLWTGLVFIAMSLKGLS
uniref:NADH-ubiquinone oxidoreductase chain 5 n=1 Tax=Mytilus californianus TaxID=6549 RepID=G3BJX1_MYTCA|nr:NADH dehydrogenase subunit 5 [Mytilus californianus]